MHWLGATNIAVIGALALGGALGGCASSVDGGEPVAYECPFDGPFDPAVRARPPGAPALVKIELTDQGELVQRCQWTDALYELQAPGSMVVVLYVHGWKHDASDDDEDFIQFGGYLARLAERERAEGAGRKVVGIYVGWPGATLRTPLLGELTYWSRQRAADRISQSAVVSKLVGAINNVRRRATQPNDLVVFIGHSFGARILYTATFQLVLYELQIRHPGYRGGTYGRVRGPAHLMVLLNPALEASAYTALDTVRRPQEGFALWQQPVILAVSASNDLATRLAFPLGQWLGARSHRRELTTLGNYAPYVTHSLLGRDAQDDEGTDAWYDAFCSGGLCLRRTERKQPGNPFIVAATTPEVLDGHSGIWNPQFIRWLGAFIDAIDRRKASDGPHPGGVPVP